MYWIGKYVCEVNSSKEYQKLILNLLIVKYNRVLVGW